MDKIRKLHRKVISVFLSLLMVLSTIIGYIPASAVQRYPVYLELTKFKSLL